MHGPLFGEFMGTMVLILLGDGVVANVLLKKSKGEDSGWIVITTGWGMAVMAGIFTAIACGSSGAHINPAVTLAVAILSGKWGSVLPFWGAQIRRSVCRRRPGMACLLATLGGNGRSGSEAGDLLYRSGHPKSSLESDDRDHRDLRPSLSRISLSAPRLCLRLAYLRASLPIYGAAWFGGLGLSLGGPTGYAMNPARDFGPRVAHAVLPISRKGGSDWGYALIPILGPLIGGAIAAFSIHAIKY